MTMGLVRTEAAGVGIYSDPELLRHHGILVAFSERTGGRSVGPYASLDLAAHVGDNPSLVDDNRAILMAVLGVGHLRERLTVAEQVHGLTVREVAGAMAGMGAYARPGGPPPVPATDAIYTRERDLPLLLCFADCVPVVLVAIGPVPGVAVVHAGWRGALGRLPGEAARRLASACGCETSSLLAYIGPHIGVCHYEVDDGLLSQFVHVFGTIAAAQGRLDLGAVVSESLNGVGVPVSSQVRVGACTAERTDAFYSYRSETLTGRHGAFACILGATR